MDARTFTLPDFSPLATRLKDAIGTVELIPGSLSGDQRFLDFLPARNGKAMTGFGKEPYTGPRFDLSTIHDPSLTTIPLLSARATELVRGQYAVTLRFDLMKALVIMRECARLRAWQDMPTEQQSLDAIEQGIALFAYVKAMTENNLSFLVSATTPVPGLDLSRPMTCSFMDVTCFLLDGWKGRTNQATHYAYELAMRILEEDQEHRKAHEAFEEYQKHWHLFNRSKKMQRELDFSREELEKASERYAALMEAAEIGTDEALQAVAARFKPERMQTLGIKG